MLLPKLKADFNIQHSTASCCVIKSVSIWERKVTLTSKLFHKQSECENVKIYLQERKSLKCHNFTQTAIKDLIYF